MAASMTTTESGVRDVRKVRMEWVFAVSFSIACSGSYSGQIVAVAFTPGTAGDQPLNLYDVELLDDDGADVLHGNGANLSNAAAVFKTRDDGMGTVTDSDLTLEVGTAGPNNTGIVEVWIR